MPVRIKTTDTQDPASFSVTLDEFNNGMANFEEHYHLANGDDFIKDYAVPWYDLQHVITEYMNTYPVAEENIAMCFTHCYTEATSLFLRLLVCEMQETTITENGRQVWQLLNNNHQLWYNLIADPANPNAGQVTPCNPGALATNDYLQSFAYVGGPEAEEEILADDGGLRFVRSITYPWKNEIWQMWQDNGPYSPTEPLLIHFAACSFTEPPGDSDVTWPHGQVMYMQCGSTVYLNNDSSVVLFHYKGADMGTMCPPMCGDYLTPPATMIKPIGVK